MILPAPPEGRSGAPDGGGPLYDVGAAPTKYVFTVLQFNSQKVSVCKEILQNVKSTIENTCCLCHWSKYERSLEWYS